MNRFLLLIPLLLLVFPHRSAAQAQCGYADALRFPVDPARYTVAQDYGAASPRHQGRYHTGEDWYGTSGDGYGAFVQAVANGRVTFSSPNGWGADGGVIILEHTFRDGTVVYSQYGHITDATGVAFPAALTCVREGDIIAAVGDARPAPHLHFEIRTNQPDIPGAGYTWDSPASLGFIRPSKFLLNRAARFVDGFAWAADIADETGPLSPPVSLGEGGANGLLVLDADRVLGISYDGRVLWRINLERAAVGMIPAPGGLPGFAALVIYADGGVQAVTAEGALGSTWSLGFEIESVSSAGDAVFAHTRGDALIRLDSAVQGIAWRVENVGDPLQIVAAGDTVGVMTHDNEMLTISAGALVDRAYLREPGSLGQSAAGELMAYTQGGLWTINGAGVWSLTDDSAPSGGYSSAFAPLPDGSLALFDGVELQTAAWRVPLPGIAGRVDLTVYNDVILLTSSDGVIAAVRASDGGVCNQTRIWGDSRSKLWHALGSDGVLRVHVADQIVGFNWREFLMACGQP